MGQQELTITEKGGKGWFFFALIPGAIAGAALMWLAFATGVVDWTKAQRIEGRMDARVGVHGELVAPVDLIIKPGGCMKITRAFLDSGKLTTYTRNDCHERVDYWEIHWNLVAPDGTILHNGYTNLGGVLHAGEERELVVAVDEDDRTAKIIVWEGMHNHHDY